MSPISAGTIRRWAQPLLFKFWFTRGILRRSHFLVDRLDIEVFPTVFHPKYFGSSLLFGRYLESLDLHDKHFLDMGTGSGIIGLYAARSGAQVTAVDVNPEAVRCAAENASRMGLRMRAIESDLFSNLGDDVFDVIAWNPPFFPQAPQTVAEAALYAGPDHDVLRRFAGDARSHLAPGGKLLIIFSEDGGLGSLESIFQQAGFATKRVRSERWGIADTMVILEIR